MKVLSFRRASIVALVSGCVPTPKITHLILKLNFSTTNKNHILIGREITFVLGIIALIHWVSVLHVAQVCNHLVERVSESLSERALMAQRGSLGR